MNRAKRMIEKCNENGLSTFKASFEKHPSGRNKWTEVAWQKPVFPLVKDGVYRDGIVEYWSDKPVRFAERNNCVGCWWRSPIELKAQFEKHPEKMQWFADQEKKAKGNWRSDVTYEQIKNWSPQVEIDWNSVDSPDCDSGHCGL
jgi:hypothetical protein